MRGRRAGLWALAAAVAATAVLGACAPRDVAIRLKPGDRPVALRLNSLAGVAASTGDFAGKVVVLNFWATWCEPCRDEMPSLQALARRYAGRDLAVVGISLDEDVNLVREFVRRGGYEFPMLVDPTGTASKQAYGVQVLPVTVLLGRDGAVAAVVVGPRDWNSPASVGEIDRLLSG